MSPPILISGLLLQSVFQQIINQRDFLKLKYMLNKILEDEEIRANLYATFINPPESETNTNNIQMKAFIGHDNTFGPDFTFQPDQRLDEFIQIKNAARAGTN